MVYINKWYKLFKEILIYIYKMEEYIIECYTSENRNGFDFNFSRDFKWDCYKVVDVKTNKILKYKCVFNNIKDFDTAIDITEYNMVYKEMKWKYITNDKKSRWNITTLNEN
jgi:hypothetical protein